jgi:hypothetical protein
MAAIAAALFAQPLQLRLNIIQACAAAVRWLTLSAPFCNSFQTAYDDGI